MTPKEFGRFVIERVAPCYRLESFTTEELENVVAGYFSDVEDPRTALYFQVLAQAGSFALDGLLQYINKAFAGRSESDVNEAYSAISNALERVVQDPELYEALKR
jgi:hypothetical protein